MPPRLERNVDGVVIFRCVELHEARARLERVADEALAVHTHPAHELRARERVVDRLRVARLEFEREVPCTFRGVRRAVARGVFEARRRLQVPVFDVHEVAGISANAAVSATIMETLPT